MRSSGSSYQYDQDQFVYAKSDTCNPTSLDFELSNIALPGERSMIEDSAAEIREVEGHDEEYEEKFDHLQSSPMPKSDICQGDISSRHFDRKSLQTEEIPANCASLICISSSNPVSSTSGLVATVTSSPLSSPSSSFSSSSSSLSSSSSSSASSSSFYVGSSNGSLLNDLSDLGSRVSQSSSITPKVSSVSTNRDKRTCELAILESESRAGHLPTTTHGSVRLRSIPSEFIGSHGTCSSQTSPSFPNSSQQDNQHLRQLQQHDSVLSSVEEAVSADAHSGCPDDIQTCTGVGVDAVRIFTEAPGSPPSRGGGSSILTNAGNGGNNSGAGTGSGSSNSHGTTSAAGGPVAPRGGGTGSKGVGSGGRSGNGGGGAYSSGRRNGKASNGIKDEYTQK
ncbi:unnamed protein product [Protopolystoma xenopodis]|uniref:Uncharacterized protein n=1 Tax=Protopolystoma xenopodis TaxID=117903 RepID=A0A448WEL8_9PLAT|nr:unnamed protein product [Protopolystoma xenopodis]